MRTILDAIFGKRVVEYRLSDDDHQLITAIQFSAAVLLDEIQALSMELGATRIQLEELAEKVMELYAARPNPEEGKGRGFRRSDGKDNPGKGKG